MVFFLEVKKCLVLFNVPLSRARPEKLCNFFMAATSNQVQVRLDCTSRKKILRQQETEKYAYCVDEDKVKALFYGARSPEATKTWPRTTENIAQVIQPGDMLVMGSLKSKS